jgi:transposase
MDTGRRLQVENQALRQRVADLDARVADLLARLGELEGQLGQRDRRIEALEAAVADLRRQLADAERAAKRPSAPFSRGEPKRRPRRPGRKAGARHGRHGHRLVPDQPIDEVHEASLPTRCPDCGGTVVADRVDCQYQTELPRRPILRRFDIHRGHCADCGKKLRGRHPLQTSGATGAAASQLGPDAQAAIVYLNKHAGLSYGKIADVFDKTHGIKVTRGACAQVVLRGSERLGPVHQEIVEHVRSAEYLTPDETGWRIGGHPAWLHAWVAGDGATLFAVDPRRSAEALEWVIGADWSGTMTHDGYSSYDRFEGAAHQQCVDHASRRARKLVAKLRGLAGRFPRRVVRLVRSALRERDRLAEAGVPAHAPQRERAFERYTERLRRLTARRPTQPDNRRLCKHLAKHDGEWFVFLLDPEVPATNHRAEQSLRTPIGNRKVWGGNRTEAGATAQGVICSVIQTCKHVAWDAVTVVSQALRGITVRLFTPTNQER